MAALMIRIAVVRAVMNGKLRSFETPAPKKSKPQDFRWVHMNRLVLFNRPLHPAACGVG